MVNNKDNRVFNYVSELGNLMFLKLALCKYLFQEHQISAGQLSADSSSTLNRVCLTLAWSGEIIDYSGRVCLGSAIGPNYGAESGNAKYLAWI